ncbi:alpha/beta hydrolase [Dactylosporangium sp. NPDC005572]|uniref:alpha/beta hydrolase n=1 Tax=Dactylosporangium sp. NPDC005572 TaxID=3156889 RepID=UPI0033AAE109
MTQTTELRGPLDADAARFLERFAAALTFPLADNADLAATDAYLAGERSRLTMTPGATLLGPDALAVTTEDHVIAEGVRVRSYRPAGAADQPRPVALYLHGGGWVSGSIELHDSTCRILAADGGLVVFSVGYRLAPEYPYPAPLDDCDRALQWVRCVAGERFGADPRRLAVVGTSSGGNLAAALALRARDRAESEIAAQVLIYPALDAGMTGASYQPEVNGRDYFISAPHMRWYWQQYGDAPTDPYFSPLAATDLTGLPPTVLVSAEFDLLRDDAIEYERRLLAVGVPVRRRHYQQIHGFLTLMDDIGAAQGEVASLARLTGSILADLGISGEVAAARPAIDVTRQIEPGTRARLDRLARWDTTSVESIRWTYRVVHPAPVPPHPRVRRSDETIPGTDGRSDVKVRWYRPVGAEGLRPGLVYFHGGAYIMGTLEENDDRLDLMADELGCAIVSVGWRVAPEHPYPDGLDDAETVWRHVAGDPAALGLDGDRLVIGGSSAGAGLATAACLRLKDEPIPQPALQLLIYPMLDDREVTPSIRALAGGPGHWGLWHLRAQRLAWQAYHRAITDGDVPPTAAPARASAEDLRGVPPAFIGIGDVDAYVDENVRYAATLAEAGVSVELHVYPGVIHGGFVARPATPRTEQFLRDAYAALASVFNPVL